MTPLRQRMIEELQRRNFAERTIPTYVQAVASFARHFGRSPEKLGLDEIRQWQLHLRERGLAWSTYNVHVCALRFLYGVVLGREEYVEHIPYGRRPKKLPVVLAREDVMRIFQHAQSPRDRVIFMTIYACGLRVSEVVSLRVEDIDSTRMLVHVRAGKGGKERIVPLSTKLLEMLRAWCRLQKPRTWLFPNGPMSHVHTRTVQRALDVAAKTAGIKKHVTPRVLRHCFATHHVEAGTNIHVVKTLLGHAWLETTLIYTHVSRGVVTATKSPLDLLVDPG